MIKKTTFNKIFLNKKNNCSNKISNQIFTRYKNATHKGNNNLEMNLNQIIIIINLLKKLIKLKNL
jgi:hypothetical protein